MVYDDLNRLSKLFIDSRLALESIWSMIVCSSWDILWSFSFIFYYKAVSFPAFELYWFQFLIPAYSSYFLVIL